MNLIFRSVCKYDKSARSAGHFLVVVAVQDIAGIADDVFNLLTHLSYARHRRPGDRRDGARCVHDQLQAVDQHCS